MNAGFALLRKNAAVSSRHGWVGGWGMARTEERICTNLLKRSIDGWKGNLDVIWKCLQLDPKKSKVPARRLGWCDPSLWYGGSPGDKDTLILFSFASLDIPQKRLPVHSSTRDQHKVMLVNAETQNWTGWSSVPRTGTKKKTVPADMERADTFCTEIYKRVQIADPVETFCRPHFSFVTVLSSAATLASCSLLSILSFQLPRRRSWDCLSRRSVKVDFYLCCWKDKCA